MPLIRHADLDTISPYLAQHAANPVDWYLWGDDAFEAARDTDRPILLSVGYAACHWCHVMAHESFEDADTAALMNRLFINVKVDREERPDVDRVYMDALVSMTGHGGWPMTVFLTPSGEPFHAGTYWPNRRRRGMPAFVEVLQAVAEAWAGRRDDIRTRARRLSEALGAAVPAGDHALDAAAVETAAAAVAASHDDRWGGFSGAPKFPQAPVLEFLLRREAFGGGGGGAVRTTLRAMAGGGIYDRLGGGFARYSTDGRWLVPHFEKMLYDNALLARVYLRAWQLLGDSLFRSVAVATLDYMMRDLGLSQGGFASSEDADSEGGEGAFYVFTWDAFREAAGADTDIAARVLGVSPEGNFEGANILHSATTPDAVAADIGVPAAEIRAAVSRVEKALAAMRAQRPRPGLDDKAVTAWNGLALRAFAEAAAILHSRSYADRARAAARFLLDHSTVDGRLMRSWRNGVVSGGGFGDDYAAAGIGLLTLYQATGEEEWAAAGLRLAADLVELFWDTDRGGFFAVGGDTRPPIHRSKDLQDNPTPGGNSLGAELMGMAGALTGEARWRELQAGALQAGAYIARRHPLAMGHLLAVAATIPEMKEVAVVGDGGSRRALVDVVWESFRPDCVLAWGPGDSDLLPLLAGRAPVADASAAYVCRDFTCEAPVMDATSLRRRLGARPRPVPQ